jgi:hypothetical protein
MCARDVSIPRYLKTAGLADTSYRCISMNFSTKGERVFPTAIFYSYPCTKHRLQQQATMSFPAFSLAQRLIKQLLTELFRKEYSPI